MSLGHDRGCTAHGSSRRAAVLEFALLVGILLSCAREPEEKGVVSLAFGRPVARAFAPTGLDIGSVDILATGPEGARVEARSSGCDSLTLSLKAGAWHFEASAKSAAGLEVAVGGIDLVLAPAERRSATLPLLALGGTGDILLSWVVNGAPGGNLEVRGRLAGPGATQQQIQAGVEESPLRVAGLTAGAWSLELQLMQNGVAICGLADSILVGAGMETRVEALLEPPEARLSLSFALPLFEPRVLDLEPAVRRIASGGEAAYRARPEAAYSWFLDGNRLPYNTAQVCITPDPAAAGRIDCIEAGDSAFPAAGTVVARQSDPFALSTLTWRETIQKGDTPVSSSKYPKALSGLRDLAFDAEGRYLLVAGKESNALTLYSIQGTSAFFVEDSLSTADDPGFRGPSAIVFAEEGAFALSEGENSIYWLEFAGNELSLAARNVDPILANASDVESIGGKRKAYVAATSCDSILIAAAEAGSPAVTLAVAAAKDGGLLASFDAPSCLSLSADGSTLAVGTSGDDALYLFARDALGDGLGLAQRIDKADFSPFASLSDPCSVCFGPDGAALYVLSYYGKAVFRLDRDTQTGLFSVAASARSGVGGVSGFAYPKTLTLSADGSMLVVAGSGATDGISLFDISAPGRLAFLGSAISNTENQDAVPARPTCASFAPLENTLVIGADDRLSIFNNM